MDNYGFLMDLDGKEETDPIKLTAAALNLMEEQRKRLDRAIELFELEREGRIVIQPCKVGDTVLREQEERSKGCEWCEPKTSEDGWPETLLVGLPNPNKICPNCGRKLERPMVRTNADRIRAMPDEELAESCLLPCPYISSPYDECKFGWQTPEQTCAECISDWLQQPAKE